MEHINETFRLMESPFESEEFTKTTFIFVFSLPRPRSYLFRFLSTRVYPTTLLRINKMTMEYQGVALAACQVPLVVQYIKVGSSAEFLLSCSRCLIMV